MDGGTQGTCIFAATIQRFHAFALHPKQPFPSHFGPPSSKLSTACYRNSTSLDVRNYRRFKPFHVSYRTWLHATALHTIARHGKPPYLTRVYAVVRKMWCSFSNYAAAPNILTHIVTSACMTRFSSSSFNVTMVTAIHATPISSNGTAVALRFHSSHSRQKQLARIRTT